MDIKKINDEVFYTSDTITKIDRKDMVLLKAKASANPRRRVRLCSHRDIEDSVHEMLIVFAKDTYIRPHKHLKKIESCHIIEGSLKVVVFDESGGVKEVIGMGDYLSGEVFYYRLSESYFHTLIALSDFVVLHETTTGPFRQEDTVFASWAPQDNEYGAGRSYLTSLITEK